MVDEMDTDSIAENLDAEMADLGIETKELQGSDESDGFTPSETPIVDESEEDGDKGAKDKGKAESVDYDKQIRNMQSMHDKQFAEQKAEIARLTGVAETLARTQTSASDASLRAVDEKEQEAFTKGWMEKIEENPGEAVRYHQQMAYELIELTNAQTARMLDERLQSLDIDNKLRQLQPGYKESQEKIQEYVKEFGVSEDVALKMVNKFDPKADKSSSQPARPKVPGRVDEGKAAGKAQAVTPIALDSAQINSLKAAGLNDKDILKIQKEMAQEMAS